MKQEREIHIAHVTHAMHCGGMENFILRVSDYLSRKGFCVEIITTEEKGQWFDRISEMNLKGHHVPGLNSRMPCLHSFKVGRQLQQGNYEVIFLHQARFAQASIGLLPDAAIVIPILHSDAEPVYREGCGNQSAWNVLVGVSPKICEEASRRSPGRSIVHIPYGVEIPSENFLRKRRAFDKPLRCVCVARLQHDQKGILFLPQILKGCLEEGIEISLNIAGEGPDRDRLEAEFRRHGVVEQAKFLGVVPSEQIYDLLAESHLLLLPSFYEGFGIVLLEAQACGCVPVASRLPKITDVAVDDGQTGLLAEVGDVQGFVQAIGTLYRDPGLWSRLSLAGQAKVRQSFSVEAMGEAYIRLINQALAGSYPLPRSRRSQRPVDFTVFTWRDFLPPRLKRTLSNIKRILVKNP